MPIPILPETFVCLLSAFAGCFTAPSYRNFEAVVAGWVHCLGRRTVTAVALAAGIVGERHISVCHRFFGRAVWTLDTVGQVLFGLAAAWVPADQRLYVLVDDTLARKGGKRISLAAMHHDPLRSTAKKPFFSFGHVWVVAALWVPLPMGGARGFALPILVRLYAGRKRGGQADAPSRPGSAQRRTAAVDASDPVVGPTKRELAREMVGLLASWAGDRPVYAVADSLYAGRTFLDDRPANVHVVTRLRMDAALWAPPPPRQPGEKGRPRRRGARLPSPQALADARQHWHRLPVTLYGRAVTTQVFRRTALWYAAVPGALVRIVVVRDPAGYRKDEAFVCTDPTATVAFVLEAFARRWSLEVSFHDAKQSLGFEDPPSQTTLAVRRTAPLALLVYGLVVLWYAGQVRDGRAVPWPHRPWYPRKTTPSFADMLAALRRQGWRRYVYRPPSRQRRLSKSAIPWPDAVLATA